MSATTGQLASNSFARLNDHVGDALISAANSLDAGDLVGTAEQLNRLRFVAKNDLRLHLLGTRLAEAAGNAAAAEASAKRALEIAPDNVSARIDWAVCLVRKGELGEALTLARNALQDKSSQTSYAVLERVVVVANNVGDLELASEALLLAHSRWPGDARVSLALAENFRSRGMYKEALQYCDTVIASAPQNVDAIGLRATLQRQIGNLAAAAHDYERLLETQPENKIYAYLLDVCRGMRPDTQPADMITSIFDGYADRFDTHLLTALGYRAPEWAASRIRALSPRRDASILDLGCGTGLLGYCLGQWKTPLVGVDLSAPMMKKAERWNIYGRLHHADLVEALRDSPADQFDLITALDVFVYVGRLEEPMKNIARVLRAKGSVLFTCEETQADEGDFVVRPSARYAMSENYVIDVIAAAGLKITELTRDRLRTEGEKDLPGLFVVATREG